MLDVSNNRFPLLQNSTTPNDLQQSSTVQKFSGVNTAQGTGAGTNQDALTFPDEGTSYFPTNPMLQMPGAFTVECWVKATAGEYVFYGGTGNDLKITVSNSTYPTTFSAIFNYGGTNTVSYDSGISSLDNNWHFLAFVRNSSNVCSFYVDGVQTNTGTTYTYNFDMRRFQFMGNPGTSGSTMRGYTDQLRITNGVARYTGNFTPPTKPFPRY
jgi:hypothetical protein